MRASKEQLERVKKEKSVEYGCDYAVSVEKMTNILWYKLGNGLGGKDYPTNVSAVLKARMLLASKISQNISRVYEETRSQFITGEITEEQLASRIITLHRKPTAPEELTYDALDESLDFSIEYLTRFEEQVSRSNEALQEKDRQLKLLRDENKLIRTEKDSALAENERELQEQKIKASELEAQLEEYHKKDKEKERKRKKRKRAVRLFASLAWKLVVVAGVVIGAKLILTEQNNDLANAISIAAAVLGAIPVCISFVRNDFKKYKEADKDNH